MLPNGRTPAPMDENGALAFTEQRPTPQNGATIHLAYQGVPVDLQVSDKKIGQIEQLIAGLLARGWTAPPQPTRGGFGGGRVKPEIINGERCCPVHKKPIYEREWDGRKFWSCPSKAAEGEKANKKGYCDLRFDV